LAQAGTRVPLVVRVFNLQPPLRPGGRGGRPGTGVLVRVRLADVRPGALASMSEEGDTRIVTLEPVEIEFAQLTVRMQSIFRITEGTGEIEIIRRVIDSTDKQAMIGIDEYITACYGTTEYSEDLTGVSLTLKGSTGTETIDYAYQCREAHVENIQTAEALVPQLDTRLSMRADTGESSGYFREGFAFSPMYTIGIKKFIKGTGELHTWLKVEKAS
jgi:hypothetical protein